MSRKRRRRRPHAAVEAHPAPAPALEPKAPAEVSPPSPQPIRILLVEDRFVVREGLKAILGAEADMKIVGEAENGSDGPARYLSLRPDVTLLGMSPGASTGEATAAIRKRDPGACIVVVAPTAESPELERALRAGASACLVEGFKAADLLRILREVHAGRNVPRGSGGQPAADPGSPQEWHRRHGHRRRHSRPELVMRLLRLAGLPAEFRRDARLGLALLVLVLTGVSVTTLALLTGWCSAALPPSPPG